jgi:hypothetical protein
MAWDAMESVASRKKHIQGIGLAKDRVRREIVGVYLGRRAQEGAHG